MGIEPIVVVRNNDTVLWRVAAEQVHTVVATLVNTQPQI